MSFIPKSIQQKQGIRRYIGPKRILLLIAFLIFVVWAWSYYHTGTFSPTLIEQYRDHHPVWTILLFILIYIISVIAALPSLPLNLAAGFFWGGLMGGIYSTIGVTIGGWISFTLARYLIGQPLAKKFSNKWAGQVQSEFEKRGWKFIAFIRVNPIIPTGPLNYLLGLTSLSNKDFLWTSFVFLLPPSIAMAYIGDTLQTFTTQQSGASEIIKSILIASAAVTFLVGIKFGMIFFKKQTDEK